MLESSRSLIEDRLGPDAVVLDVGGWAQPLERADWVIDLMPYETRGLYGYDKETATERFSRDTWVEHDICSREPWPFTDGQFDFAICSHTLEDIRDPVWVCQELQRVARAGYIEVPSRLEEQAWGVQGNFVGWTHHRWLIDVADARIDFTLKVHGIHGRPRWYFPNEFLQRLDERARVECLWWEEGFEASERILMSIEELEEYLTTFVNAHGGSAAALNGSSPLRRRLGALRRRLPGAPA
jgi:hypothetical protein